MVIITNLVDQGEVFIKILDEDGRLYNVFQGHILSSQYLLEVLYDLSCTICNLLNTISA
jgi:hypothetical protein